MREAGLPVAFSAPVTDHAASDDAGTGTLGEESEAFWRDHKGAGVNAIRTQTLIRAADVVVVRFGDKYRQWNAAFDAGFAAALGKPIVTLHDPELDHALKEVDRAAQATARDAEQVVDVLRYVIAGELPAEQRRRLPGLVRRVRLAIDADLEPIEQPLTPPLGCRSCTRRRDDRLLRARRALLRPSPSATVQSRGDDVGAMWLDADRPQADLKS